MNKTVDEKLSAFLDLATRARDCGVCPLMTERTAVLSELNGALDPVVMFIAEAPGRQGADRTRKPFFGDKSGDNFQAMLDSVGFTRDRIFITNTVLCSPRSDSGANRRPRVSEIKNCSSYLRETIDLISPKVVATLGAVALEGLKSIEYHQIELKTGAARIYPWNARLLVPLYHPSPQVIASRRSLTEQIADFRVVADAVERS